MAETIWIGRARFAGQDEVRWVRVRTLGGVPAADDVAEAIENPWPHVAGAPDEDAAVVVGRVATGSEYALVRTLTLQPPADPSKIIGIGRNYRAHAAELGNEVPTTPMLFFKPPSALVASGQPIVLPGGFERIDMEAELVLVIGRHARHVPASQAWQVVGGYTLGNDVSCRDLQKLEKTFARAKGYDTFAPLGPWVRVAAHVSHAARIRGYVDGRLCQDAPLEDMVFDIPTLIESITAVMTLVPGDLIYSGTPSGVTPLQPGSLTAVELEGGSLGRLENPVVAAS